MSRNALFINYQFCSGCRSCEFACRNELELELGDFGMKLFEDGPRQMPDGKWHWDFIAYPTELCDLCEGRTDQGMLPSCVQTCQAKCLEFGTVEECMVKLEKAGKKAAVFVP